MYVFMYMLRLVDIREEKVSESKHPIDEEKCFTAGGLENPHWVCRDYREDAHIKDNYLVVDKYYVNCTQANRVYPDENSQFVLCSTSRLSYIYELVPVSREELIQKMRRIVENVRVCRSILAGELLYAIIHNNRLYVLNFFYDPVLHSMRTVIKYVLDKVRP